MVTEAQLSVIFESVVPHLSTTRLSAEAPVAVVRELECHRGRPDFVVSPSSGLRGLREKQEVGEVLSEPASSLVLSLLHPVATRTRSFLAGRTGLSSDSFKRALARLLAADLVAEVAPDRFRWADWFQPEVELWAFELKVRDWRRAIYQAMTYRAFAHRSVIVMPREVTCRLAPHLDRMRRLSIGLAALDTEAGTLTLVSSGRRNRPGSLHHYFYALGQLLSTDDLDLRDAGTA